MTNRLWINMDIRLTDVATLFQHVSTLNQRWVFDGLSSLKLNTVSLPSSRWYVKESILSVCMLLWWDWLVGFGLVEIFFFDVFRWVGGLLCTGYPVGDRYVLSFGRCGVDWCISSMFVVLHHFEQGKMYLVEDLLFTLMKLVLLFQIFVVYFHKAFQTSLLFSVSLWLLLFPLKLPLLLVCFFQWLQFSLRINFNL